MTQIGDDFEISRHVVLGRESQLRARLKNERNSKD